MATQDSTNPSTSRNPLFRITAAAREALARIAAAMRAVRLSFRASRNARSVRPLIDVTYCQRCHEVIVDGDLCDVCTEVVARENSANHVQIAQRQMMAATGAETPGRAWETLFAQRLAAQGGK